MTHERDLAEALSNRRKKYFPDFIAIAKNLVSATMATLEGGDSKSFEGEPDRHKILSEPVGRPESPLTKSLSTFAPTTSIWA